MFKLIAENQKKAPGADWGSDARITGDKIDILRCGKT